MAGERKLRPSAMARPSRQQIERRAPPSPPNEDTANRRCFSFGAQAIKGARKADQKTPQCRRFPASRSAGKLMRSAEHKHAPPKRRSPSIPTNKKDTHAVSFLLVNSEGIEARNSEASSGCFARAGEHRQEVAPAQRASNPQTVRRAPPSLFSLCLHPLIHNKGLPLYWGRPLLYA